MNLIENIQLFILLTSGLSERRSTQRNNKYSIRPGMASVQINGEGLTTYNTTAHRLGTASEKWIF